jgi:hypothetical protein
MKAIPLDRLRDVQLMQMRAAGLGYSASAEMIEQLIDQLQQARQERAEAIARLQEERAELERTRAEMEILRLLGRWPEQRATMQ